MPQTLLIVESPAKTDKIEKYLGVGFKCIASYGHIRQLDGLKSIDIANNFSPRFVNIDSKMSQINKIARLIKQSDEVLLATDDDREGEAIAWHICQTFDLPIATTKRIIFHEVTKPALQRAVQNPTNLNMNIVNAQLARQILDLLVGYKISPILWECISRKSKKGLSAGRCQSPALRLVYDNQMEIDKSPGRKVYNTTGYFTKKALPFVLSHAFEGEDPMADFLESSANFDHKYQCGKIKHTTKNPPRPFTTSRIQQMANNELNCSPKDTMKICQKLYEMGKITYMRTDSETYSKEFIQDASKYIIKRWGENYIVENVDTLSERSNKKTSKKKAKENAQEAHEAIRPTDITCEELKEDLSPKELKMYKMIWRNTVESCMSPAKYYSITATITAPEELSYKYSSEQVNFAGWKIVAGYEKENPTFAYLQTIANDNIVNYSKISAKVSLKDLKMHYTEAKLVQLLEKKGIGRPSTFSSLIDKIQEREYVKKGNIKGKKINCTEFELIEHELSEIECQREFGNEKNKLIIQPLGILVIKFLIEKFDNLFNYEYTADMEQNLDVIAKGEMVWHTLCNTCFRQINDLSSDIERKDKIQIQIDENHIYMIGKYGPVIKVGTGDNVTFKSVKTNIDLDKLKRGEYELDDLIDETNFSGRILGEYEGNDLILKKGKFGMYVAWGDKTKSLLNLKINEDEITRDIVIDIINNNPGVVRNINEELSIRNSKYGDYIFYKTSRMKKPRFLKLNKCNLDYKNCSNEDLIKWVQETYKIK